MPPKTYNIIYEDQWLIVIDKPSGMLVIPTPKKETNTLSDLVNKELDLRGVEANAYPCHRLDRETSGLIIYAKGKNAQGLMMEQFKRRRVRKSYVAFAQGKVKNNYGVIEGYIRNLNKKRDDLAITKYKVTGRHKYFSVLRVEPVTGRTNQIRIQLKAIGHPLVGESVYAFRKDFNLRFKRAALHAESLEFLHPVTKKMLKLYSPMPSDMAEFLKANN